MNVRTTKFEGGFQMVMSPDRTKRPEDDGRLYTLLYETETGTGEAVTRAHGIGGAKRNFKNDVDAGHHGSDAYITDEDGCEYPMDW